MKDACRSSSLDRVPIGVNLYATVRELPALSFHHALRGRRDRSDPELAEHLQGFMGFVMQGGRRQMTATLFHVISHLQRVQHHVSLEIEEAALDGLAAWAVEANAILFLPDGSVRHPTGPLLVNPQTGESDDEVDIPYPTDALDRKQRTMSLLAQRGMHAAAGLPPVVGETEVRLRAAPDVFHRACSLLAVAIRAESLASETPLSIEELRQRLPEAFVHLTASEEAFMSSDAPEPQDIVNHAWRYECASILQWALGLVDVLRAPSEICDVPRTARTLVDADRSALLASATLRPAREILDALDEHFRLHWMAREARRADGPLPGDLDAGVLAERHHALNWLVRFQDATWDEVDTPT